MAKGAKKVKKSVAPAPTSTAAAGPAGAALKPPETRFSFDGNELEFVSEPSGYKRKTTTLDIDEINAVKGHKAGGVKGSPTATSNKQFLDSTTNQQTKKHFVGQRPNRPKNVVSLSQAKKAGSLEKAAEHMLISPFDETKELNDLGTDIERRQLSKTKKTNSKIRRSIREGKSPIISEALEKIGFDPATLKQQAPAGKSQIPKGSTVQFTPKDAILDPKTGRVVAPPPKPATAMAAAPKPVAPVSTTPKPAPVSASAPKPTAVLPDLPKPAAAPAAAPKPTAPISATPRPAPVSAPAPKGTAAAPAVPQSAPQVHAPKASTVAHGVSTEAKTMAKVGKGARILAKLGKAGKFGLKAIPILGALVGTASAAEAAERGDYTSASLDMAGNIPIAGDLLDAGRGGVALGEAINEALDMEEETNMYGSMAQSAAKKIGFGDETSMYIGAAGAGLSAITVAPTTAIANKVKRWWRGD